jgi:hypothetical protein
MHFPFPYSRIYHHIIAFRITGFLDFVHHPVFQKLEKQNVSETNPVPESRIFLVSGIPDDG